MAKQRRGLLTLSIAAGGLVVGLFPAAIGASSASAATAGSGTGADPAQSWAPSGPGFHVHQGAHGERDVNVCTTDVSVGTASCLARVRTDGQAVAAARGRAAASSGSGVPYSPASLQAAYNLTSLSSTNGVGQTVAIVDAYDDPNALSDVTQYRSQYGLPPLATTCGGAGPCFSKVNESGKTSPLPGADSGWSLEISLDLDMVSAVCPNCNITLIKTNSASYADLGTAENEAVALHANVVSNSYGGGESSSEASAYDPYYNHPGVAIVVATGDNGYGVEYPASSQYVTAVGGTTLNQTGTSGRNATETAWSGAGSGCSSYETKPAAQVGLGAQDSGCSRRAVADVSAVADPNTGVYVYDTYGYGGGVQVGGTSAATPIVGSVYALAGNKAGTSQLMSALPYQDPGALNDITSGSNGSCSTAYLCTAGVGYDGPTGLGTPNGDAGFAAACASTTGPCAPTALAAAAGDRSVGLSWSAPTPSSNPNFAVTGYDVYRGTSATTVNTLVGQSTGTSFTDNGSTDPSNPLTDGQQYFYAVTAVSSGASSPQSNVVSVTPNYVPAAPQSLTAGGSTGASSASVNLMWATPTGSPPPGSSYTYKIYRGTSSSSLSLLASGVSSTVYTDNAVANGTTYYYAVSAVYGGVEGPRTSTVSAEPLGPPTAPQNLKTSTSSFRHGISLSWSAPASNGGASISGYRILRGTTPGGESTTPLATVTCSSSSCSYSDTTTTRGAVYYYVLEAVNTYGPSNKSNEVHATAR